MLFLTHKDRQQRYYIDKKICVKYEFKTLSTFIFVIIKYFNNTSNIILLLTLIKTILFKYSHLYFDLKERSI